jgi:ribonuclease BN (tRNA processing enzyme)
VLASARILGSGGFIPTDRRDTSSLLLLPAGDAETAVVVDAGTGIRRLVADPSLLAGRRRLDVLLTHFHPDHICGLPYLSELDGVAITIHGPGLALHGLATRVIVGRHMTPTSPDGAGGPAAGVEVAEYGPGEIAVGALTVHARIQEHHPGRSIGLRFGDALAWCTDTEADPATAAFARGVSVLAHESWVMRREGHTPPADAARIAIEAGAPALVLIHVPPHVVDDDLLRAPAAAIHPNVVVATDGLDLLGL